MDRFIARLRVRFTVGKISAPGDSLSFCGGQVHQAWAADGQLRDTTFSMVRKLAAIEPVALNRVRRKQFDDLTTPDETRSFRRLAGQISYVGLATVPSASFVASWMHQQLPDLRVHHIVESTRLLKDLQSLPGYLRFEPTTSDISGMELLTFVDASHHSNAAYSQTGVICLLTLAHKTLQSFLCIGHRNASVAFHPQATGPRYLPLTPAVNLRFAYCLGLTYCLAPTSLANSRQTVVGFGPPFNRLKSLSRFACVPRRAR
jgi:hypothetical protein